jgi:putative ABC transport system ATP-binding protein
MSALGALGAHATGVRLDYGRGREAPITALAFDELVIAPGERVGLVGPSGAGKTSLLYVLSGIERPQQGRIRWGDDELAAMGEGMRDRWRLANAGFVFQEFHLIPGMTALQNVLAPVRFARWRPTAAEVAHARTLLAGFGAPDDRRPVERMSRGEQQRVALARALTGRPRILFADEPTASLDQDNAAIVADSLLAAAADNRCTLVCVTHDPLLMRRLDRLVELRNGRLVG